MKASGLFMCPGELRTAPQMEERNCPVPAMSGLGETVVSAGCIVRHHYPRFRKALTPL